MSESRHASADRCAIISWQGPGFLTAPGDPAISEITAWRRNHNEQEIFLYERTGVDCRPCRRFVDGSRPLLPNDSKLGCNCRESSRGYVRCCSPFCFSICRCSCVGRISARTHGTDAKRARQKATGGCVVSFGTHDDMEGCLDRKSCEDSVGEPLARPRSCTCS